MNELSTCFWIFLVACAGDQYNICIPASNYDEAHKELQKLFFIEFGLPQTEMSVVHSEQTFDPQPQPLETFHAT